MSPFSFSRSSTLLALVSVLSTFSSACDCGGERAVETAVSEESGETRETEGTDEPLVETTQANEGSERLFYSLSDHPERAELRQGEELVVDFGTPQGEQFTLGGWRTRVGEAGQLGDRRAVPIRRELGEVLLPSRTTGAAKLTLRMRTLSRDGRATLYLGEDAIHYANLPRSGEFATVHIDIDAEKLTSGENVLQIRGQGVGAADGMRGSVAIDWMRLAPAGGSACAAPSEEVPAPECLPPIPVGRQPVLPQGWSLSWRMHAPEGARLRGEVEGRAKIFFRAESGDPELLTRASGEFDVALPSRFGAVVIESEGELARIRDARVVTLEAPAERPEIRRPRNVLIWLVDTVRADRLRPYNPGSRVQTPGLDRWARRGVVFEHSRAQENWTKPSVATLLTGLLPWQHTATTGESVLPNSVTLISERLQRAGFHTGAFICNGYVSRTFGFRQGFTTWRNYIREGRRTQARFVANDVLEWLDERPQEEPFFLYVHTIDPHVPYIPPDETLALYDEMDYHGPVDFTRDRELLEAIKSGRLNLNVRDRQRLEALYDGEITYHDMHYGAVLDGLEERGLADDTMVIFTADHGEEFFDHDSVGHGHSLFEELLHVPLVMRIPGIENARVSESVGLVDVVPTLLDALQVETQNEDTPIYGRSLLPLLRGEAQTAPSVTIAGFMEGWRAVVSGRYKLIHRTHRRWMLYDLEADPGEENDIAADHPEIVRHLRGLLGMALSGETAPQAEAETTVIDDEMEAQLRALGYVGSQRR